MSVPLRIAEAVDVEPRHRRRRLITRKWSERDWREFVQAWQFADSCDEAAEIIGIAKPSLQAIAARLRDMGVPLKRYRSQARNFDVEHLAAFTRRWT